MFLYKICYFNYCLLNDKNAQKVWSKTWCTKNLSVFESYTTRFKHFFLRAIYIIFCNLYFNHGNKTINNKTFQVEVFHL